MCVKGVHLCELLGIKFALVLKILEKMGIEENRREEVERERERDVCVRVCAGMK